MGASGRDPREKELNSCPPVGLAFQLDRSPKATGDDAVDDMQAKADAALVATRGEERIERLASIIGAHAAAVVGEENFNIILASRSYFDLDAAFLAVGKRMGDRIEEQVGQHLSVRSGIAVHGQIGLAFDLECKFFLAEAWPQAQDNLFGQIAQIEHALT